MGRKFDDITRAKAIKALERSASRSRDRIPNTHRLARELGIERVTLINWWKAHTGRDAHTEERLVPEDGEAPEADAASHDEQRATAVAWAQDQLDIEDETDWRVQVVADCRQTFLLVKSDTARVQAAKLMAEKVTTLRPVDQVSSAPTPEEMIEQMCGMPELMVQAFLRCPELWDDTRIRAAIGA